MRKKITILMMLIATLLQQNPAVAQSKQKAEKAFLKELNNILKNSDSQHWDFDVSDVKIDSIFTINTQGILSVSVRYKKNSDSSFVRARMVAPINKIDKVLYDLYLILGFKKEEVTFYDSEPGSNELIERNKTILFHIGEPKGHGEKEQQKLQKLLDNLLKYYKN